MEGMINDLAIGAEQSSSFEAFCRENPEKTGIGKVEFTVQVLTTGHWPQYKPLNEINLPSIMQRCTQVFKEYYDAKTQHRKLTWTHSLGNASIKGNFQNLKKSYDLQVTTVQAIVMLCFNQDSLGGSTSNGIVTFNNLLETLNMPEDVLKKVLHSLSCGKFKILKKVNEDGSASAGNAIRATDAFLFNDAFTYVLSKFSLFCLIYFYSFDFI
jgi:cullin 1